jgi:nucleotide-binding universal stress UspA family protein
VSTAVLGGVAVVVWVFAGVLAALVLLGRQGYRDLRWYLIGAVLGPLFIPIAAERADRSVTVEAGDGDPLPGGSSVVVGVDGSPGSDRAVLLAASLFGAARSHIVLVTVVDPDAADAPDDEQRSGARSMLSERARWFGDDVAAGRIVTRVVYGQPTRAIETTAETHGAAVVVLGRRGAGLSRHLLGSVATQITQRAAVPVLLADQPESLS